jgi:hypothetical protein
MRKWFNDKKLTIAEEVEDEEKEYGKVVGEVISKA